MAALFHPKVDIAFKMLFSEPDNERLLISLLTAVLRPQPILGVTVLNRELLPEQAGDRALFVDLLVRLEGGGRVNVEMQCDPRGHSEKRWLFQWARVLGSQLERGQPHTELERVIGIVFLDARISGRFHAIYGLREVHDHTPFGDDELLEIHLLELPLLDAAPDDLLHYWVRFLRTVDAGELESLAKEHPIMAEAKEALERLSADPAARALYEARLKQRLFLETVHETVRAEGRAEGLTQGLAEGMAKGRVEGLDQGLAVGLAKGRVEAILGVCELLAIPVDDQLHARLARAELTELDTILTSLRTTRALPG